MAEPKFRQIEGIANIPNDAMVNRLLRKDVSMANRFPGEVTIGARKKGVIQVAFYANGSAGNYSASVSNLNLGNVPLTNVWYLGWLDKNGVATQGGGLVPGSAFSSGTVLSGMEIFSGATANYCCTASALTVKVTSTNVGYADLVIGFFYYAIYYDMLEVPAVF